MDPLDLYKKKSQLNASKGWALKGLELSKNARYMQVVKLNLGRTKWGDEIL